MGCQLPALLLLYAVGEVAVAVKSAEAGVAVKCEAAIGGSYALSLASRSGSSMEG